MYFTYKDQNIFAFADTHGKHRKLQIPIDADIIVCAGDVCVAGDEEQIQDFFGWYAEQPAKYKLFVPGNHDLPFELAPEYAASRLPAGITYIEQGSTILEGIRFYVLPVRLGLHELTAPKFLPKDIDILITHCPPAGILDAGRWGCPILRKLIEKAEPKIHLFGHCHSTAYMNIRNDKTAFYNVAVENNDI
jgi:Icc-related predicted phosphoesterase